MTPAELTATLHQLIPLTRAMEVEVTTLAAEELALTAPLTANHNHAGTAFAGSLSALASVAGWAFLHRLVTRQRLTAELVLADGHVRYRRPVQGDLQARLLLPEADQQQFLNTLTNKVRAKLQLTIQLYGGNEKPDATFEGIYIASLPPPVGDC